MGHRKVLASSDYERRFVQDKQRDRALCETMMEITVKLKLSCYCQGCRRRICDSLKREGGVEEVELDDEKGIVKVRGEGLEAERILKRVKKVNSWAELAQELTNPKPTDRSSSPQQKSASAKLSPPPVASVGSPPPPAPPGKPSSLPNVTLITERSLELDNGSQIRTRVVTTPDSHTCIRIEETRFWIDKFSHQLRSFSPAAST